MDEDEFRRVLEEIRINAFRVQIVRFIRDRQLLIPTTSALAVINCSIKEADDYIDAAYIDELCILFEQVRAQINTSPVQATD